MFRRDQLYSHNNIPRTSSLFAETCRVGDDPPIMSLNGKDDLPCLRDYYVALVSVDPSEASFAEAVFGDVRYWLYLREQPFFQKYLAEFRELASTKRKQMAFEAIIEDAKDKTSRTRVTSAKYLIEEPWIPNTRRTKETKKKTTEAAVSPFKDDITRLREEGLLQ